MASHDFHEALVGHQDGFQKSLLTAKYLERDHLERLLEQIVIALNHIFLGKHSLFFFVYVVCQLLEFVLNLLLNLTLLVVEGLDEACDDILHLLGLEASQLRQLFNDIKVEVG